MPKVEGVVTAVAALGVVACAARKRVDASATRHYVLSSARLLRLLHWRWADYKRSTRKESNDKQPMHALRRQSR